MFKTLISSNTRRKVLKHFLSHPQEKYYVRQLALKLLVSVGSLHKELIKLEKEGILQSEYLGNLRFFSANTAYPLYEEIKKIILNTESKT